MTSIGCQESIDSLPIVSQAGLTLNLNPTQFHLSSLSFCLKGGQFFLKLKQFCFKFYTPTAKESTTKEPDFLLYQHNATDERIGMSSSTSNSISTRHLVNLQKGYTK